MLIGKEPQIALIDATMAWPWVSLESKDLSSRFAWIPEMREREEHTGQGKNVEPIPDDA